MISGDYFVKKNDDPSVALMELSKYMPLKQPDFLEICPYFIFRQEIPLVKKHFPTEVKINTSDPLGPFFETSFNKEGDSYRSPWSNKYFPPNESAKELPNELRELELKLIPLIKLYTKLYYDESVIFSVYSFSNGNIEMSSGFDCYIIIRSEIEGSFIQSFNTIKIKFVSEISDSNRQIKVIYNTNTTFLYKFLLKDVKDDCCIIGSNTCDCQELTYSNNLFDYEKHCKHIGSTIEKNEANLRGKIDEIYFKKNKFICKEIRNQEGIKGESYQKIKNLKKLSGEFKSVLIEWARQAKEEKDKANNEKNKNDSDINIDRVRKK